MLKFPRFLARIIVVLLLLFSVADSSRALPPASWVGLLTDASGKPLADARVIVTANSGTNTFSAQTSPKGEFQFAAIAPGTYTVTVQSAGLTWKLAASLTINDGAPLTAALQLSSQEQTLQMREATNSASQATGGGHLSSGEVSSLPLNERDFSKLLLLAAGTMTDSNGAANFTQQFAVNGQRGVDAVFAMDNGETTDPELGGSTFTNFNVDAIHEVQSSSGVMPSEIGHGAAGFTNVITKSGTNQLHGSIFEFVRNAAFDARNYFDHPDEADPRRIPPFARNEFGATIGGPVVLPGIYNGEGKTFFFGEYQGFRQVLGTTQVLAVPTAAERAGIDTTTFPGDTLTVPISPEIAPILARYPLPNQLGGPYGDRTYATSSKVVTDTDQFSIRIDHRISDKATLFTRFSLNQVNGPTTNPDQTAIDPSFAVKFFDHQRSAAASYARTVSPHLTFTDTFAYIRSTPIFPAENQTDIGIAYGDGLFEGFNSADGSITGSYGNLFQFKHDMAYTHGTHSFKWGAEIRLNFDATVFGTNISGLYTFGGGTAYATVPITSASGMHNIHPGDPLPDTLTALLSGTPYEYTISESYRLGAMGDRFNEAAVRRQAYNFYFQDSWKPSPRWTLTYGLRYELNSRIKEAKNRTSVFYAVDADGKPTSFFTPGATQEYLYNPQPVYPLDKNGWGPRASVDYALTNRTTVHAGGAITTILPNLWQQNYVTGSFPLVFQPIVTALPSTPVPFSNSIVHLNLPEPYTTSGQLLFPTGDTSKVAANTPVDVPRFLQDLQDITPGDQVQLLSTGSVSRNLLNGYIGTFTAGVDHDFGIVKFSAAYVGTAGVHLARVFAPNGYAGAGPAYAPFTQFDSSGHAVSGYGPEYVMSSDAHSSYNSLQVSVTGNKPRIGLSFQASYTFSKSLDDTSTAQPGSSAGNGTILQTALQNPRDFSAEKGPSPFDVTHGFSLSLFQALPFDRVSFLQPVSKKITAGWQLLNITSISSGPAFTVYSGIQQTDAGAGGADRPDLVSMPDFSTSRARREDYFGLGANNASFFFIPINVPGGTGPNDGRFGTLGRNTFRGPAFHQLDFALIKDTPFGKRGNGELGILEFRAEFFNLFNIVNFGLPANDVLGSGFGIINHTAGTSRQIQFSLKIIF
jgi:hypothetical protein